MPFVLIIVLILVLWGSDLLPGLGAKLGTQARKPYRQAKWMWALVSGTEAEALRAEEDFGRECAREFARQFAAKASAQDQELVSAIGSRIALAVKPPRRSFNFSAVRSSSANAFALPGGYVFITEALLDACGRDREEIAFFLAHEIGHVVCGHAKDQMAAGAVLHALSAKLAGASDMIRQVLVKGYSRSMELDADREAVRLVKDAGLDPAAAARALQRLQQIAPDTSGLAEYFSSHPSVADRIRALGQGPVHT